MTASKSSRGNIERPESCTKGDDDEYLSEALMSTHPKAGILEDTETHVFMMMMINFYSSLLIKLYCS